MKGNVLGFGLVQLKKDLEEKARDARFNAAVRDVCKWLGAQVVRTRNVFGPAGWVKVAHLRVKDFEEAVELLPFICNVPQPVRDLDDVLEDPGLLTLFRIKFDERHTFGFFFDPHPGAEDEVPHPRESQPNA